MRPKIADYPFTTLVPNLGVVGYGEGKSFVVADIPGLIEGAHAGHGLGHKFLRHVTRTSLLIHLLDASNIDEKIPSPNGRSSIRSSSSLIRNWQKPQIVVANKIDLPAGKNHAKLVAKKLPNEHQPLHSISAATREGVRTLVQYIGMKLEEIKQQGEMVATQLDYKKEILRRARRVVIKIGSQILSSQTGIEEGESRGWCTASRSSIIKRKTSLW